MFFLAVCLPLRAQMNSENIYAAALPSILTLEVETVAGERFIGSAFLGLRDGLAVTAWHVIHDARKVEARFSDNRKVRVVGLVDKDEQHDLALVKLETNAGPSAVVGEKLPRVGSRAYVIGTPNGYEFSIREGLVSQIRTLDGVRYYQISCPISGGDSGAPLLNDRAEVIGMVSWRKTNVGSVGFATPGADIARLNADRPTANWPLDNPSPAPETEPPRVATLLRSASSPQELPGDFHALQKFLADRVGKQITVTTQEDGRERRFSFEVPEEAATQ